MRNITLKTPNGDTTSFGYSSSMTPRKLVILENPHSNFHSKPATDPGPISIHLAGASKQTKILFTFQRLDKSQHKLSLARKKDKKSSGLPSFLADLIGESQPAAFFPNRTTYKKEIDNTPSPKKSKIFEDISDFSYTDRNVSIEGKSIPTLNFRDVKSAFSKRGRNRSVNIDDHHLYKPYVIEVSPKSRMTLYSTIPIRDGINLADKSFHRRSRMTNMSKNIRLPQLENQYIVEKTKKIETKDQLIVIDHHSKTFAEKLQRVKEVADSTDFNNP